jgi:hypothetical protein
MRTVNATGPKVMKSPDLTGNGYGTAESAVAGAPFFGAQLLLTGELTFPPQEHDGPIRLRQPANCGRISSRSCIAGRPSSAAAAAEREGRPAIEISPQTAI